MEVRATARRRFRVTERDPRRDLPTCPKCGTDMLGASDVMGGKTVAWICPKCKYEEEVLHVANPALVAPAPDDRECHCDMLEITGGDVCEIHKSHGPCFRPEPINPQVAEAVAERTRECFTLIASHVSPNTAEWLRRAYPEAFDAPATSRKPSDVLGWLGTENGYTQGPRPAPEPGRKADTCCDPSVAAVVEYWSHREYPNAVTTTKDSLDGLMNLPAVERANLNYPATETPSDAEFLAWLGRAAPETLGSLLESYRWSQLPKDAARAEGGKP